MALREGKGDRVRAFHQSAKDMVITFSKRRVFMYERVKRKRSDSDQINGVHVNQKVTPDRKFKRGITVREGAAGEGGNQPIFVLDIGTRSVIGIVGEWADGVFYIYRTEKQEYTSRAVVDGQIENIAQTAKIAGAVKTGWRKRPRFL